MSKADCAPQANVTLVAPDRRRDTELEASDVRVMPSSEVPLTVAAPVPLNMALAVSIFRLRSVMSLPVLLLTTTCTMEQRL